MVAGPGNPASHGADQRTDPSTGAIFDRDLPARFALQEKIRRLDAELLRVIADEDETTVMRFIAEVEALRSKQNIRRARERAAHLHGFLRVDSAPGAGTRLTVEVPPRMCVRPTDPGDVEAADVSHGMPAPEAALG